MWLFEADRDPSQPPDGATPPSSAGEQDTALERYRMYGHFYERYWSKLFGMTQADMTRYATRMREQSVAMSLTDLARDVIRGRLQTGPQLRSGPAPNGGMPNWIVRQWDPGANWRVGDRAVVVIASPSRGRAYAPRIGEVIHVKEDRLVINIDGVSTSQVYELGPAGYARQDAAAEAEMLGIGKRFDEAAQIDFVLWRYGARIVSSLLHALDADSRFVELEGLWFLRELALQPSEGTLSELARTMFDHNSGPMQLDDILSVLSIAADTPAAVRFGLAQALDARDDLFENVGSSTYPRWQLAAPPPLPFKARRAVYDPETFVVLCVPGETLSSEAAQQLWRTGLLRTALDDTPPPPSKSVTLREPVSPLDSFDTESSPSLTASVDGAEGRKPDLRLWQRWLRRNRG